MIEVIKTGKNANNYVNQNCERKNSCFEIKRIYLAIPLPVNLS